MCLCLHFCVHLFCAASCIINDDDDDDDDDLRPPPRGTRASMRIYLIFPETRIIGVHFCRCMYGSIFSNICAVCSTKRTFLQQSAFWPFKVVQGHPRSMILVPIESAYATSY